MIAETGMITGKVVKVSGHIIVAEDMREANLFDVTYGGDMKLAGEIFEMRDGRASIRLYDRSGGISCGDTVVSSSVPLSAELGPGLVGNIFDGFLRPLDMMYHRYGANIPEGTDKPFLAFLSLDREKKWHFIPAVESGAKIKGGDIIGTVEETPMIIHKVLVPPNLEGEIAEISEGEFTVDESVAALKMPDGETVGLFLAQKWAVRRARPYAAKTSPYTPMITGKSVIDSFLPIASGGTACISGSSGSGKTAVLRQIAKRSDADIIVYVGCGTRGGEMAELLRELSETKDPQSGHSLIQRTVLIANTSDMSAAVREASVYTGVTVAEYFRDMGYSVTLIVDSLSQWADAVCEISAQLEEMQDERSYPVYLASRFAQLYERAGKIISLGSDGRDAALTVIGSVSPSPFYSSNGGNADVVAQSVMRAVRVFWSLNENPAYRHGFASINLCDSYSMYKDRLEQWYSANIDKNRSRIMRDALKLLQAGDEIQEETGLAGVDTLSDSDRLILEVSRSIREDYLSQDSSANSTAHKQYELTRLVMEFYQKSQKALQDGANIDEILQTSVREKIEHENLFLSANTDDENETAYEEILETTDTTATDADINTDKNDGNDENIDNK